MTDQTATLSPAKETPLRFDPTLRVPDSFEAGLDPAWLTQALGPYSGGRQVQSATLSEIIRTTASKALFEVRFEDAPDEPVPLCMKAFIGADQAHGGTTTMREADFYQYIAPHITMRVPPVVSIAIDRDMPSALFIMNDMIAAGSRFCLSTEPFTVERTEKTLDQIARLHGGGASLIAANAWLPDRLEAIAAKSIFPQALIQDLLNDSRGVDCDDRTRDAGLLLQALKALAERFRGKPQTILHGDCHAGNVFVTGEDVGFTDWQIVQRGYWPLDIAYHISAVLPIEVAERHERELLDHYIDALARHGGPMLDREAAWEDFRAAQIYGFYYWAITQKQPRDITDAFTQRLGAGVMRHESYRLLGL